MEKQEQAAFRTFASWATRDTSNGKLEYDKYINPLCDLSFSKYMQSKQIIGGEYRAGDNRQKGIPPESLFESLVRHVEILKLLTKWYTVAEEKVGDVVRLHVAKPWDSWAHNEWYEYKTIIWELNAIRFNWEALKLHHLNAVQWLL